MLNHLSTTQDIPWPLFLLFYFYFETRSYKIAQLSLSLLCSPGCKFQLAIFLPQPLSIWDYRPTMLCQDSDSTLTGIVICPSPCWLCSYCRSLRWQWKRLIVTDVTQGGRSIFISFLALGSSKETHTTGLWHRTQILEGC